MYDFTCNISHLCCLPFWRSDSDKHRQSSLTTFQVPTSTLSVPLPYNTVPHGSGGLDSDNERALHHIFSSSSSIRGYHTAATTPGYVPTSRPSLDLDFKFGESSPNKSSSRAEQISNHIKQKLSGSRLSRSSSKKSQQESVHKSSDLAGIEEASPDQQPFSTTNASQSTAGLSGLLASGNASQGGYDSDAKSLNSPVLGSRAGTITVNSNFVRQALEKLESRQSSITERGRSSNAPSASAQPLPRSSLPLDSNPASPPSGMSKRTSFVDALQMEKGESPQALLRRLSSGITEGTIDVPDTPELRASRLPSIKEVNTDWHLTAPKRSSSLPRQQDIEAPSQTANRSALHADGQHLDTQEKRESLISQLDPRLLDFIDSEDRRDSNEADGFSAFEDTDDAPGPSIPNFPLISPASEVPNSLTSRHAGPSSNGDTDRESIHLFNMRISQRLASRSRLPVSSSNLSPNTSRRSFSHESSMQISTARRVSREHNRQPSNPETRLLFENYQALRDQSQSWKTINSVEEPSQGDLQALVKENASSCYSSNVGTGTNSYCSTTRPTRRNSQVNPHSLAVPGRTSIPGLASPRPVLLSSPSNVIVSHKLRRPQEPTQAQTKWTAPVFAKQRGRSASMPQRRNEEKSPTPVSRRQRDSIQNAERMSEISLAMALDRRNENLTEISVTDLQTGRADGDEVAPKTSRTPYGDKSTRKYPVDHCSIERDGTAASATTADLEPSGRSIMENATDVWTRAFQQASEAPEGHDQFLRIPR